MTTTERPTVVGVFSDKGLAQHAVDDLKQAGFDSSQIHYANPDENSKAGFWQELKGFFSGRRGGPSDEHVENELDDLGLPQNEVQYYEKEYNEGNQVLAVRAPGRQQEALNILRNDGAYNYDMQTAGTVGNTMPPAGYARQTGAAQISNADVTAPTDTNQAQSMHLREEHLSATKERVQAGEVGLRKEVVTEQKNISVPVTHDEVFIEQHPVSGQTTNEPIDEGETVRIPVTEEQVNVTRQTIPTEEVSIGKRRVQETQQVTDTVKREEPRIEREGNPVIHDTRSDPYHPSQKDANDLLEDE